MSVRRKVTINVTVDLVNKLPGTALLKGNLTYEPLDNGLIQVTSNFGDTAYHIEPKDLIETVVAVASGVLLKQPDMQRQLRESLGLIERGDASVEVLHSYSDD